MLDELYAAPYWAERPRRSWLRSPLTSSSATSPLNGSAWATLCTDASRLLAFGEFTVRDRESPNSGSRLWQEAFVAQVPLRRPIAASCCW